MINDLESVGNHAHIADKTQNSIKMKNDYNDSYIMEKN